VFSKIWKDVAFWASLALSTNAFQIGCAHANPGFGANLGLKTNVRSDRESGPFSVPPILRARVDFWKDIFGRYGASQTVIHHRDFPQIVFGVIDLSQEKAAMSPVAFDRYKDSIEKRTVDDLKAQLLELSTGAAPHTTFQEKAVELLQDIPGGPSKYKRIVDEDLVRTQTGIRERYAEAVRRASRYLPIMEQIFTAEYGLPKELTRIPFIESSFDYTAYSSVGAAGIWQFMPRTARAHRMTVGRNVDERRDPIKATRAAAEYLRSAYNSLGTWPLAITSYNHGVGGVRSKVRRAGTADLATIIEDPNERYFGFASTNFYPEFLAAVEIFADPQKYFPEVREESPLQVVSYQVGTPLSASQVASRLGIPTEDLKEANYALLDTVWSGRARIPAGYTLRVPAHYKDRGDVVFSGSASSYEFDTSHEPLQASYKVKRGEDLDAIARKFGISKSSLMRINQLSNDRVQSGQELRLIEPSKSEAPRQRITKASASQSGSSRKSSRYVVRKGDTLGAIANKTRVTIERLKQVNGLHSSTVRVGQTLILP
jgi:membrane-bound lytic murein transglycosylase D